jgi:hypothetical protein
VGFVVLEINKKHFLLTNVQIFNSLMTAQAVDTFPLCRDFPG